MPIKDEVKHELKLLRRSLRLVDEHLDKLDVAIAVEEANETDTHIDVDITVIAPCDEYGGTDANYFVPPEDL